MKQSRSSLLIAALAVAILATALVFSAPMSSGQAEHQELFVLPTVPPTPTVPPAPPARADVGAPQSGVTLAMASFDEASALDGWRIVDLEDVPQERRSLWIVVDGRLRQDRTVPPLRDPSIHETAALIGDASWNDYTISAGFYDQDNANVGLIVRYQDGSYYRYRIIRNEYEDRPKTRDRNVSPQGRSRCWRASMRRGMIRDGGTRSCSVSTAIGCRRFSMVR